MKVWRNNMGSPGGINFESDTPPAEQASIHANLAGARPHVDDDSPLQI